MTSEAERRELEGRYRVMNYREAKAARRRKLRDGAFWTIMLVLFGIGFWLASGDAVSRWLWGIQ